MRTIITAWQRRRSEFNHDWLKNHFLPALARFFNLLDQRIEDAGFERIFVSAVLTEWESHCECALKLALDFEREMSPQCLFDHVPLSGCDEECKQWLSEVAHALWLARYPIHHWIAHVCGCVDGVNAAYAGLREALRGCPDQSSAAALRPYRIYFEKFRERCYELSGALEQFPHEIKAT